VESSDDAIITKDLNGTITNWNSGAERLFGYTHEEAIGKPVLMIIPKDRQHEEAEILARLRRGERIDHFETIRQRKDGSLLDISLTVSPLRDENGKLIGASKVARDVTEVLRAREMVAKTTQELERRVEERTASLTEVIAQMEEFSYSVSHDLRAPIRAMQGYAYATIEGYGEKLDKQGKDFLNRIVRSAERMDRLVTELLAYSRMARAEISLQTVELEPLLEDVVSSYPEMQPPRADIHLLGPFGAVIAHEPSLAQAVANLLRNAVKFVAPNVKPSVDVYLEPRGQKLRLWVHDNGIGIKPEHQGKIFGLFERVHSEKMYEGTGIGLAMVRKSVERMGGKVGMESNGCGSKFWIELAAA
jgi:PAS domain S-box-containing protein